MENRRENDARNRIVKHVLGAATFLNALLYSDRRVPEPVEAKAKLYLLRKNPARSSRSRGADEEAFKTANTISLMCYIVQRIPTTYDRPRTTARLPGKGPAG